MHVADTLQFIGHSSHLMEVSCKETVGVNFGMQLVANGPGYPESLGGAGPPSQLVYQHQRTIGCRVKHCYALYHLTHECGDALHLHVRCPHSRDDGVNYGCLKLFSRHIAPNMSQISSKPYCTNVSGFTSHVWARQNHRLVMAQIAVVGDAGLDTGMMDFGALEGVLEGGATPRSLRAGTGVNDSCEGSKHIELTKDDR